MRPFGRRKRGSMLNRTDVRRECHKITFNRGEELQQKGAVRRLNWEKKKEDGFDVVQMDATVSGSGENLYIRSIQGVLKTATVTGSEI